MYQLVTLALAVEKLAFCLDNTNEFVANIAEF